MLQLCENHNAFEGKQRQEVKEGKQETRTESQLGHLQFADPGLLDRWGHGVEDGCEERGSARSAARTRRTCSSQERNQSFHFTSFLYSYHPVLSSDIRTNRDQSAGQV